MELTVRTENEVETIRCSYVGNRLVANGDWNTSINTSVTDEFLQSDSLGTREEKFIDTVLTLEILLDIGSNDHLRSLVRTARDYARFQLHVAMDGYVAILLEICHSEERNSLKDYVFGALWEVMMFQVKDLPISEQATSDLVTCIFEFLQVENNDMSAIRVCLEILKRVAINTNEYFVPQDRILIIFDILNRPGTSEISEYVLRLVKVILRQPALDHFWYFKHVLPSLEKALQSSDEIIQMTAARLYYALATSFERFYEFIRMLTSKEIVQRIGYLLAHTQDWQSHKKFFEESLNFLIRVCHQIPDLNISCLISRTILSVLTGSTELPKGEFELVLNPEYWNLMTHLVVEVLSSLSICTDSLANTDEYGTEISEVISCLFRISQKIFLSPSCGWVSKLWCLESFQYIIDCGWDDIDFDNFFIPFLKCNEVVQRLMEALLDFNIRIFVTSVSVIDMMLTAIPHIVAKPFSMFELNFALDRSINNYKYLIRNCNKNRKFVLPYVNDFMYHCHIVVEKQLFEKMIERLEMVKSRFCNLAIENIDQNSTTLDNLQAAVKSLSEQKELHLIRMAIEDEEITPYMILETNFVPSLLYFLIGVDDIVGALKFHHSELNLGIGDKEKTIRNNNIKKFLNIFLGCETDGSCPPLAKNTEPFIKLINVLQSAMRIVGCLHFKPEFGRSNAQVQELLLHTRGNRDTFSDANGTANMLDSYLIPHFDKPYVVDDPSSGIISLLNVLYGINEHYGDLYPPGSFSPPVPDGQFVSNYITKTFMKFTSEAGKRFLTILPMHMWKILLSCPFLVEFKRRLIIFRLFHHWDCKMNKFRTLTIEPEYHFSPKALFSVSRNNIIEESEQYFTSSLVLSRALEVNFKGEMGTGNGPTQEFYTFISKEIQNTKFNLWRGDTSLTDQFDGDRSTGDYVVATHGLFPKPISGCSSTENNAVRQKFELLGKILAKALLEKKVLDLNLNDSFIHLFLRREQCMGMTELYKLDPQLAKTLSDLKSFSDESQKSRERTKVLPSHVEQNNFQPELDGCSLDQLCLDFTLPGYPEIELQKNGRNTEVNIGNLDEYIRLVIQWTLQTGVHRQVKAFWKGFSRILPVEILRMFSSKELRVYFSVNSENQTLRLRQWIEKCYYEYYDKESQVVKFLLEIVSEYDSPKQKLFLQFVTGAPSIPMEGHGDWKLQICHLRAKDENKPDETLPIAMTCAKALYLPEYSNKEIMRDKLDYALQEGLNSFQMV